MNWTRAVVSLACLALSSCAGHGSVEGANWIGPAKSPVDMRFYPPGALRADKSAVVGLSCFMHADGHLDLCQVGYVSTPGFDFEGSALRMADEIIIRPEQAKVVAADHAKFIAEHHIAGGEGTGWVAQPIYLALTQRAHDNLAQIWRSEGGPATKRFAMMRPDWGSR